MMRGKLHELMKATLETCPPFWPMKLATRKLPAAFTNAPRAPSPPLNRVTPSVSRKLPWPPSRACGA
eukprot:7053496-Pyramimonas_sp.AAC.1